MHISILLYPAMRVIADYVPEYISSSTIGNLVCPLWNRPRRSTDHEYSSILHGGMHHPTLRGYQTMGRSLTKSMLMYPIFISDDPDAEQVIETLPGQKRWGINKLEGFLSPLIKKGLKSVILFGVPMKMEKVGLSFGGYLYQ